MLLRRFMGLLAAFAIVMIVGSFAAGQASAHNGHSHGRPAAQAADVSVDPEVALALAVLASEAGSAQHGAPAANHFGTDRKPPCDGHCCAMGGTTCCGFVPASLQSVVWVSIVDVGLAAIDEIRREGLDPASLLRPPRSFA